MMLSPRNRLLLAIRHGAILREENQRLISPNGGANSWLIDMRRIFMDAELLDAAAELFWSLYADRMPFQVGGMEVAAIPLLTAILMKSKARGAPVSGFIVRKERKAYGAGALVEGHVSDLPVVIVDDVINSGKSLEKVHAVMASFGRSIASVFVLADYRSRPGLAWRASRGIEVVAPFTLQDFGLSLRTPSAAPPQLMLDTAWSFSPPDPNFFHRVPKSFPATDDARVYFGSDSGTFWALDARSGEVAWTFKVNARGHKNIWSSPALHDGRVIFGAYDGNAYCLDAATGCEVWRFEGADWIGSSPAVAADLGLVFIGLEYAVEGRRGGIVALDLQTGERVWEHPTRRYTHASPAYWPERGLVACGSNDDEMFLFEARTGALRWRFQTRGEQGKGSIRHAPAFDTRRGHLVTGCADGTIYIIDVETGREVWSVQTDNTIYTVPLVVGDLAFVGSTDKYLYVLDLGRREVKSKLYAGSKVFGPPRLLNGQVYFGACSGLLYALDPQSGEVVGTHQLPDAITNAPTYSEATGLLYVSTYVNQLFALQPPSALDR
jgi:outer membrane protein assembly factor BamB